MTITFHKIIMFLLYGGHSINALVSLFNVLSKEPMKSLPCNRVIFFIRVVVSVVTILVFAGVL